MYITHVQKNVGDSPRKLRLVADMVRKMEPEKALETLQFTHKAAAESLSKAIKTALANAGSAQGLVFANLQIDEGLKMKRMRPGTAGRGRGRAYKRRLAHIRIVLTDEVQLKSLNEKVKNMKIKDIEQKLEAITEPVKEESDGSKD